MTNNLGKIIKARRETLSLTQHELAQALGITVLKMREVELGNKNLSRKKLKILASMLQIRYSELLESAGYELQKETRRAKSNLLFGTEVDTDLILLLGDLVTDKKEVEILRELISVLNKMKKRRDRKYLKQILHDVKVRLYRE